MSLANEVHPISEAIKDYYGRILESSADPQTSACCTAQAPPRHIVEALREVHDEVKDRFYGCGSPKLRRPGGLFN